MLLPTITLTALATLGHAYAHVRDIAPRQTDPLAGVACAADFLSIAGSMPTPPPALLNDLATVTNACSYTPPASVASDFSKYTAEFFSWASANQGAVNSALSKCPEFAPQVQSASEALICSTAGSGDGGSGSPAPTGTSSGSGTGGSGTGNSPTGGTGGRTSTAAGPKETGFVAGVLAVAGFVGAVAAL